MASFLLLKLCGFIFSFLPWNRCVVVGAALLITRNFEESLLIVPMLPELFLVVVDVLLFWIFSSLLLINESGCLASGTWNLSCFVLPVGR